MAASLPGLEVTGERIPTPKDWNKDEYTEIIVQDPIDDRLFETHDVETPYMVESWLKGNSSKIVVRFQMLITFFR